FAGNELAVIFPAENPAGLRTLSDLADSGIKIVMASPSVPAGHYATLLLDAAGADPDYGSLYKASVLDNVVSYEENVRAVLSKVRLGVADAGIVYQSDVAPKLAGEVGQLTVPQHLNVQALYPIAPISDSQNPDLANRFIDFVLSPQGQEMLMENGLKSVAAQ
ncbi:MAG: molybdate ABC transporter substrate-binding protein, partial [Chloroflexota bacterium]